MNNRRPTKGSPGGRTIPARCASARTKSTAGCASGLEPRSHGPRAGLSEKQSQSVALLPCQSPRKAVEKLVISQAQDGSRSVSDGHSIDPKHPEGGNKAVHSTRVQYLRRFYAEAKNQSGTSVTGPG